LVVVCRSVCVALACMAAVGTWKSAMVCCVAARAWPWCVAVCVMLAYTAQARVNDEQAELCAGGEPFHQVTRSSSSRQGSKAKLGLQRNHRAVTAGVCCSSISHTERGGDMDTALGCCCRAHLSDNQRSRQCWTAAQARTRMGNRTATRAVCAWRGDTRAKREHTGSGRPAHLHMAGRRPSTHPHAGHAGRHNHTPPAVFLLIGCTLSPAVLPPHKHSWTRARTAAATQGPRRNGNHQGTQHIQRPPG
jgi:hypothetical protein